LAYPCSAPRSPPEMTYWIGTLRIPPPMTDTSSAVPFRPGVLLAAVALCAAAGIVLKIRLMDSPNWVSVAIYAPLGMISIVPMALLWHVADTAPAHLVPLSLMKALLVGGLAMYGIGGMVYALRRPDPGPQLFGFHGLFHVCVLAGAGLHGAALYYSIRAYPVIRECVSRVSG